MRLRLVLAGLLLAGAALWPAHAAEPDPRETKALHALFDRHWEALAERFPEFATYRGDLRFNDRWVDLSPAATEAFDQRTRAWLDEAKAIRRDALGPVDRVSLDMFVDARERDVAAQRYAGWRTMLMGSLGGAQSAFADQMQVQPVATRAQVDALMARIAAYPRLVEQQIALMRRGITLGWVPSRDVLVRVLAQLDGQLGADLDTGPLTAPWRRLGTAIPADERATLQAAGRAAVARHVLPALQALRRFIVDEYQPKAPADGALAGYPEGRAVYDLLARRSTTTDLGAEAIHAIGQRELVRLRAEMDAVRAAVKFDGDFAAFVRHLNTDPKFFHTSPEALLAGYRDIAKRIDAELPRLFAELPRAPYGVRAMPAFRGPDAAEYYDGPARDGSRPGWFNAAATGFAKKPIWGMATLTAHEAVPGHHLQTARAQELQGLPEFRKGGFGYIAYSEGWALYAETLGREIGLYDDPYALFGHLQAQAWRAARLVVDTGLHALGWKRQQAIDFLVDNTGVNRDFMTSEVDRYISNPGQALAYMIGQLKIVELRQRAQARLGAAFDLRRFHNAVIDQGALPLSTLERLIDEWISAEAARGKAPA